MKRISNLFILILLSFFCFADALSSNLDSRSRYIDVYEEIEKMLQNNRLDFRRAVYLTENIYLDDKIDENDFYETIRFYGSISKDLISSGDIEYSEKDKDIAMVQCGVFIFMTDSTSILINGNSIKSIPFSYNHEDPLGQKDWTNMFVSKLMETNIGNCHSLPYLYKIIMDELGYKSHLALAPNHIYIKANNKKVGWYNIELTCADFPTDAWYAASGYIHTDAIRNGIYMRALSDREAIAMTLVDLAQGYQAKFGMQDGSFIIKCCDTALEHFPNYINAMLLKAEILTELYRKSNDKELFSQMTELYTTIHKLGYRKMPQQMYTNWVNSLKAENRHNGIKAIMNPNTKIE
ncbi:MAG: hypothetical protein QM654_00515 [Dysgonamonadaceae bacterium]